MKKCLKLCCIATLFSLFLVACQGKDIKDNETIIASEEVSNDETVNDIEESTNTDNEGEIKEVSETVDIKAGVDVRVGALKGPTSIGLLKLEDDAAKGLTANNYEFTMVTAADELMTMLVKGELDIALIPANVSSVLYNKTEGKISVIDINTLGVLYIVSGDDTINSIADLEGKTIYLTGKGNTPDYTLSYILRENELLDKVTLEYKSEATEVAVSLAEDETAVGLLPQPFVTAACMQNDKLKVLFDMNTLWDEINGDKHMVTGVSVVRNEFLLDNKEGVDLFLADHDKSVKDVLADIEGSAALAVDKEIIAKEPIAMKAIPQCNITCITGDSMKDSLSNYLDILFNMDPKSVGGSLPIEDFYYIP